MRLPFIRIGTNLWTGWDPYLHFFLFSSRNISLFFDLGFPFDFECRLFFPPGKLSNFLEKLTIQECLCVMCAEGEREEMEEK